MSASLEKAGQGEILSKFGLGEKEECDYLWKFSNGKYILSCAIKYMFRFSLSTGKSGIFHSKNATMGSLCFSSSIMKMTGKAISVVLYSENQQCINFFLRKSELKTGKEK